MAAYLLDGLLVIAFLLGLLGVVFFTCVLANRAKDWGDRQSISPDLCRFCGRHGWHAPGCGLLDRLDTPTLTTTRETRP